ncbi:MAG: riboflavin synthase [Ignavibacteria bacterium]|jgi:riboflavin synthase|nr:riboflavin synthase [Ignavibacteria bacterium]
MFTGLIEEIGTVKSLLQKGNARRFSIEANSIFSDLKVDDSVAINGCCQTVIKIQNNTFEAEAVEETLRKTTLGSFVPGHVVNLERAVRLQDRLGGHLVQGHVDCIGTISKIRKETLGILLRIAYPSEFRKYIAPTGSICIDGVSLTVAKDEEHSFTVAIIPHSWSKTVFPTLQVGSKVNLEFDIIGKYVEKILREEKRSSTLSEFLKSERI